MSMDTADTMPNGCDLLLRWDMALLETDKNRGETKLNTSELITENISDSSVLYLQRRKSEKRLPFTAALLKIERNAVVYEKHNITVN